MFPKEAFRNIHSQEDLIPEPPSNKAFQGSDVPNRSFLNRLDLPGHKRLRAGSFLTKRLLHVGLRC